MDSGYPAHWALSHGRWRHSCPRLDISPFPPEKESSPHPYCTALHPLALQPVSPRHPHPRRAWRVGAGGRPRRGGALACCAGGHGAVAGPVGGHLGDAGRPPRAHGQREWLLGGRGEGAEAGGPPGASEPRRPAEFRTRGPDERSGLGPDTLATLPLHSRAITPLPPFPNPHRSWPSAAGCWRAWRSCPAPTPSSTQRPCRR